MGKLASSTIPTSYIAVLLDAVRPYGVTQEALLQGSVKPAFDDYFHQTALPHFIGLVERAIALTRDEALGFQFGRCMSLASHGMPGVAASNQGTIGGALEVLMAYSQLRVDYYFFRLHSDAQAVTVELGTAPLPAFFTRFVIEGFMAFAVSQLGRAAGDDIVIGVAYERPATHRQYEKWLGRSVQFGQACHSIRVSRRLLQKKIGIANPALARLAMEQCREQLQAKGGDIRSRVEQIIRTPGQEIATRESVARQLNMSPSTLGRRLAEEGTNFVELAKAVRFREACEYLEKTDKSVAEIAGLLAYTDASNFGRVFRREAGCSPTAWRKKRGG